MSTFQRKLPPTWAVQTNLTNEDDVAKIDHACRKNCVEFLTYRIRPFSEDLPDIPTDRPVIFYGSTGCTTKIGLSGKWKPGVWSIGTDWTFAYGGDLLNADAKCMTLQRFCENKKENSDYFIRPLRDDKLFSGMLISGAEVEKWYEELKGVYGKELLESQILVASPKNVPFEWRMFMVGGKVSTGSHYRRRGELDVYKSTPDQLVDFCENTLARRYAPAMVYVLDVCWYEEGYKLVEVNGMNSSGFYASDVGKLVGDIGALYGLS